MKQQKGITLIALIITIIVMLILVGVTVNVAINGDLFETAKQATSGMNMAQVEERALVTKLALMTDMESDKTIMGIKTEYLNRLKTEFNVTDDKIVGNKIIVENDKYDIVVKNADLDIEVIEHNEYVDTTSILSLDYGLTNTEIDGKLYATTVNINLTTNLTQDEYVALKVAEAEEIIASNTIDKKRGSVLEYLSEATKTDITSIDQYFLLQINSMLKENGLATYNKLEDCLEDENVRAKAGVVGEEKLTKGQIYNYFINGNISNEMSEEDVVETFYSGLGLQPSTSGNTYIVQYQNATKNLTVSITKDGTEIKKINVRELQDGYEISQIISENGTYEILAVNANNEKVLDEKSIINIDFEGDNHLYVLSEKEAATLWKVSYIDSIYQVTDYLGNESNVIVPIYIGENEIKAINGTFQDNTTIEKVTIHKGIKKITQSAFANCTNLEEVIIQEGVTEIGSKAFKGCTKLKEIKIPRSVTSIYDYGSSTGIYGPAFCDCTNLTNIYLEAGSTLTIPEKEPWGAINATVTVLPAE